MVAAVCRPLRARKPRLSGSSYFPALATDTTDNEGSSDESLDDVMSRMGSDEDGPKVTFSKHIDYVRAPPWDFHTNDQLWHSLWYTVSEIKDQGIRYMTMDREVPFLDSSKALFRAKSLSRECNEFDLRRSPTCGMEFWWPVVWKDGRAHHYNEHVVNGDIDELQWEETFLRRGNAISYSRNVAIKDLAPTWHCYWHMGDIPLCAEIARVSNTDTAPSKSQLAEERKRKQRIKTRPLYEDRGKNARMMATTPKHPKANVKYWLADTGCGYDLVSRKHVAKVEDRIKKSNHPLTFCTANGATEASADILLHVDELDEEIEPFVMASTPAVLSIGRRCIDFGYEFRWPAGKLPYFITPSGVKVTLIVEDYVPYLRTGLASRTHHAVATLKKGMDAGAQNINTNDGTNQLPNAVPGRVKKEPRVKVEPTDFDAVAGHQRCYLRAVLLASTTA